MINNTVVHGRDLSGDRRRRCGGHARLSLRSACVCVHPAYIFRGTGNRKSRTGSSRSPPSPGRLCPRCCSSRCNRCGRCGLSDRRGGSSRELAVGGSRQCTAERPAFFGHKCARRPASLCLRVRSGGWLGHHGSRNRRRWHCDRSWHRAWDRSSRYRSRGWYRVWNRSHGHSDRIRYRVRKWGCIWNWDRWRKMRHNMLKSLMTDLRRGSRAGQQLVHIVSDLRNKDRFRVSCAHTIHTQRTHIALLPVGQASRAALVAQGSANNPEHGTILTTCRWYADGERRRLDQIGG